jgi:predicted RNA-binding protein with RPS1 domain
MTEEVKTNDVETTESDVEASAAEMVAEEPAAEEETQPEEAAEVEAETEAEAQSDSGAANGPTSLGELKPKQKLQGKVVGIKLYGAFVDLGLEKPGLVHISQLSEKRVQNVSDVVSEGDDVTVYVLNVDKDKGRVNLSLVEPPALTWSEMKVNDVVSGEVIRIENFGAFVDIGAERPGLIHVSELDNDYVSSVEDKVKIGETVEARIINVDRKKKQVDLSIRALEAPQAIIEEEDDEGEQMTALGLALQQALEDSDITARKKSKKRDKRNKAREQQEDIIARTLRNASQ